MLLPLGRQRIARIAQQCLNNGLLIQALRAADHALVWPFSREYTPSVPSRRPIIDLYLQARPPSEQGTEADCESIEALITAGVVAARADWPGVGLTDAQFVPYLAARIEGPGIEGLRRLAWADLYIACACSRPRFAPSKPATSATWTGRCDA